MKSTRGSDGSWRRFSPSDPLTLVVDWTLLSSRDDDRDEIVLSLRSLFWRKLRDEARDRKWSFSVGSRCLVVILAGWNADSDTRLVGRGS